VGFQRDSVTFQNGADPCNYSEIVVQKLQYIIMSVQSEHIHIMKGGIALCPLTSNLATAERIDSVANWLDVANH